MSKRSSRIILCLLAITLAASACKSQKHKCNTCPTWDHVDVPQQ